VKSREIDPKPRFPNVHIEGSQFQFMLFHSFPDKL
jgi:hypothetical protein